MGTGTASIETTPKAGSRRGTRKPEAADEAREAAVTLRSLPKMSRQGLEELFASSPAGPTPSGVARGVAIVAPGTPVATGLQPLLHLGWQGKVFYPERGDLLNRVGPLGMLIARAQVYRGASWIDGEEAIILDYSIASLPFRAVRDEIREVAPGLYLGVVFWIATRTINFALQF